MKKRILSITAVCLVLSMLTGCSGVIEYFKKLGQFFGIGTITFSDMQYTRPDMDQFQRYWTTPARKQQRKQILINYRILCWNFTVCTSLSTPITFWLLSTTAKI